MMMRLVGLLTGLVLGSAVHAQTEWVNPLIGTGGHGHTYPGAVAPFGMVQLSPDTRLTGWDGCSGYHYSDTAIYGFSHTHLSGTGVSDYGDLLLMPTLQLTAEPEAVKTSFSHQNERAEPGYYAVKLNNGIDVELTVTERCGIHKYLFPNGEEARVVLDLVHRDEVLEASFHPLNDREWSGYRRSRAWAVDQHFYFNALFSHPILRVVEDPNFPEQRVILEFGKLNEALQVWVGVSGTNEAEAANNLLAEAHGTPFKELKMRTQSKWKKELGKIQIKCNKEHKTIFYTALYHTMVVPNLWSDVSGTYRGMDNQIHSGETPQYTVFSLWDTYRAAHPLYTLIDHQRTDHFLTTFERMYSQIGRLPVWELAANETNCMIGYHAASVIADAKVKGLGALPASRALEMVVGSSLYPGFGMQAYRAKGYLDVQDEHENVSKTLEYGYDDYCVAQLADLVGDKTISHRYLKQSLAYRNLMDANGFMHPRDNGKFMERFDPREVNNHFTEANSWQYSFYVPHDLDGYIQKLGGNKALENHLDALFSASAATTGREQADITGLIGQYAHGNEPSHHIAYLYNAAGAPHKTQERVREILETMYSNTPEGLIGNEDCGQMSAWYVLSSLGLYQICPGDPRYVLGYPLFESAVVQLGNGETLEMVKQGKGHYVKEVVFNGQNWTRNYISHNQLIGGGKLVFVMANTPQAWGTQVEDIYRTGVGLDYLEAPVLEYSSPIFFDSLEVAWPNPAENKVFMRWNQGGWNPVRESKVVIRESGQLELAYGTDASKGAIAVANFYKRNNNYAANWINSPNPQYSANGPTSLVDGVRGEAEWRKGKWIGIQGKNLLVEVDLKSPTAIKRVDLGCLQDSRAWILYPKSIVVWGKNELSEEWKKIGELALDRDPQLTDVVMEQFSINVQGNFRYIRLEAEQFGTLPPWHQGNGGESFIFVDEIVVQ